MANVLPDPSTVLPSTADRTFTSSNPTTNTVAGNPREFNLGSSVSPTLTTPTTSTGTVIPANNVTSPSTPINYATPTGATQSAMNALNAGNLSATQSLQSQFDNLNSIKTNSESQQNTLTNAINSLLEQTKGQAEATVQAEQNLGVNQKLADLQASKNKANLLQAQYDQSYAKLYDPNKPIELLTGEQAAFKAQAQADIGFANADVLAKTGDLELAQNLAKKAVDAKYAPIMESINIKQAQLKLLEPILKKEDATKLSVQNMALEKQKKENELKIQEEKDFQDTVAEASAGGATGSILEKARSYFNSGNKEQAYAALGAFGKKHFEIEQLKAQTAKYWADANKAQKEADATGGITGGDAPFQATVDIAASLKSGLGVQKQDKAEMTRLAQKGDYKSLLVKIKNNAQDGLPAAERSDLVNADKQVAQLNRMQLLLEKFKANNGDTNLLKGTAQEIDNKLGILEKGAKSAELRAITTELKRGFQEYRKNMTGAAFGAQENSSYQTVYPSEKNSFELNTAIMSGLRDYLTTSSDSVYRNKLGDGYTYIKEYATNPNLAPKVETEASKFVKSAVIPALTPASTTPAGFKTDVSSFVTKFK